MKTTLSLMALFLSLSCFASFDFKLECQDDKALKILDLDVSTNGIAAFKFYQDSTELSLSSQYSDYGSLVLSFDRANEQVQAYQIYLDYMGGVNWRGTLTKDANSSSELLCIEKP